MLIQLTVCDFCLYRSVTSDVNYAELQLPPPEQQSGKDLLQIVANEEQIEGSPGKYAQLAELQKELEKESKCVDNNESTCTCIYS